MKWRRNRSKSRKTSVSNPGSVMAPEGVLLHFDVAGVGVRIAAQLTDILLTLLAMLAIVILLSMSNVVNPQTLQAVAALLFFIIRVPYYVITELIWNGQTLGKRLMKIKVVANSGGPLSTHALVVRNLMKEAEVFLPATLVLTLDNASPVSSLIAFLWILGCLIVPVFNPRRRRLGDLVAGTYVIHLPTPVLLPDLSQNVPERIQDKPEFAFLPHHLDHYGAFELQTLEGILRAKETQLGRDAVTKRAANVSAIVEKIRKKIEFSEAVPKNRQEAFLLAFYNVQRGHLEQKQLFGERRADKFHASEKSDS